MQMHLQRSGGEALRQKDKKKKDKKIKIVQGEEWAFHHRCQVFPVTERHQGKRWVHWKTPRYLYLYISTSRQNEPYSQIIKHCE